jgi:hypothetical protein
MAELFNPEVAGTGAVSEGQRAFLGAHERLLGDLGAALASTPVQERLERAASVYSATLDDALAQEDGERLVDAYLEYLEALQGALRQTEPGLDDSLRDYVEAVQEAWADVDVDDLDVDTLASLAQGTMAAAWLLSANRQRLSVVSSVPLTQPMSAMTGALGEHPSGDGWSASNAGERSDYGEPPPEVEGVVWQTVSDNGWGSRQAEEIAAEPSAGRHMPTGDETVEASEEDGTGIVWEQVRPRGTKPGVTDVESWAREEDDMAKQTVRRGPRSASARVDEVNSEEEFAASPGLTARLDDALRTYLRQVREALLPADVQRRVEAAYAEYIRAVTTAAQPAGLQQRVADLYTTYNRSLQGLGSYDDLVRSYLEVLQAGFESGDELQRVAESYPALIGALVDANSPKGRQADLSKAFSVYTRTVREAWTEVDPDSLTYDSMLAAARSIATATAVQALAFSMVSGQAPRPQAEESPPTPSRRTSGQRRRTSKPSGTRSGSSTGKRSRSRKS